jgi:NMD protein affecting ribosome stability and mRNA decay
MTRTCAHCGGPRARAASRLCRECYIEAMKATRGGRVPEAPARDLNALLRQWRLA